MSAAEVLALHLPIHRTNEPELWHECACLDGVRYPNRRKHAAHQLDALKAAGYAVIELPTVAHKGPHDTDAKFFRQVADRLEIPGTYIGGSNVRRAACQLLHRAAAAAAEAGR